MQSDECVGKCEYNKIYKIKKENIHLYVRISLCVTRIFYFTPNILTIQHLFYPITWIYLDIPFSREALSALQF